MGSEMVRWAGYGCGALALGLELLSYAKGDAREFRRWSAIGALLWALQYLFLGAWTAGLTMAATAMRTLLSGILVPRRVRHAVFLACIGLFTGLTGLSWQGLVSLLPALATVNTTLALFYFGNAGMRILLLGSSAAWIANDFLWQAWLALAAESGAVVLNLHTIAALRRSV